MDENWNQPNWQPPRKDEAPARAPAAAPVSAPAARAAAPAAAPAARPAAAPTGYAPAVNVNYYNPPVTKDSLPQQYRPLSAWAYFGLEILFMVPVVGFVFLIVFSFNSGNLNRRSFARSYWCVLILIVAIILVTLIIFAVTGASIEILDSIMGY